MKKTGKKLRGKGVLLLLLLAIGSGSIAVAQEDNSRGYNPNSVRPIHESDIMFKKTVWRRIDLKEKQNRPFMAKNAEITRVIINAVKAGLLQPYGNDSVTTKMTLEDFVENLRVPVEGGGLDEAAVKAGIKADDDPWATAPAATTAKGGKPAATPAPAAPVVDEYFPSDLQLLELKEDIIFDKQRSRLYYDIQTITIIIPGVEGRGSGLDKPVASFKYKDLAKLFRNDPKAIYFNAQNNQAHKNLADAFDLRLFHARLIKISNPDDAYIQDIYEGGKKGLVASQNLEYQLMEYEHNLWEF